MKQKYLVEKKFRTKRGYDIFELLSALQKDIRRGNEYEAMFWAVELESINPVMLWNRLTIIVSEDISIANQPLAILIDVLRKWYFDLKEKKKDAYRILLAQAILALCRSPKSRIATNLVHVVYGEIQFLNKNLEIPDYALDMHTLRGKKMKRGFGHFFEEGSKLNNEAFVDPYKKRAEEILLKYREPQVIKEKDSVRGRVK